MSITSNLGLKVPSIDDVGEQTFIDMANNLEKIDKVFPEFRNNLPTSGYYDRDRLIFLKNKGIGDDFLFINIRAGQACPTWLPLTSYQVGDKIVPNVDNGHYYECVQSGTSGVQEPNWLVASQTITEDTKNKSTWQPSKYYQINEIVVPTLNNDRFYVCETAGTSGASEPNWSTTSGTATVDNQVVWLTYKIVKWKESGIPVKFRPIGRIE